jgi:hypothetical protein
VAVGTSGYALQWMSDPKQERRQREFIAFTSLAAVIVLVLAWLQFQHGTAHTIGLIVGLPAIAVLLVVAVRFVRAHQR